MPIKSDLRNMKFARLTVIREHGKNKHGSYLWECLCCCGTSKIIMGTSLSSGKTKSCGCLQKEAARENVKAAHVREKHVKHGMSGTSTYNIWCSIKDRCLNKKSGSYKYYGGRGIALCKAWLSFETFYEDMGERPHGLSIDRRDNNGPYSPENCRWATIKQNSRNKRSNVLIRIDDEKLCISEWAEKFGIKEQRIKDRIRLGWDPKDAVMMPKLKYGMKYPGAKTAIQTLED